MLYSVSRAHWTDELTRLGKQARRLKEKADEQVEEKSIFLTQRSGYLSRILAQGGLETKHDQMKIAWVCSAIGVGLLFAVLAIASGIMELVVVLFIFGLLVGAGGFISYLQKMAQMRQAKMTEQLPQSLETMVSALRAGSPIMEAFKVLSETAPDPIRAEFKRGLVSLQLGKPFRDVMNEMSFRIRTPDFKLLVQAIFISQEVGGNLADVVAVIAEAIRERFKLRDFLNALTAQGKATAFFIGCLPYLITIVTYVMTPGYIVPFLNHPVARIVMAVLICWELFGFWILMKMTTFEV